MPEMNVPTRLAVFTAVLVVSALGAFGVGNAVGPIGGPAEDSHGHEATSEAGRVGDDSSTPELPGGLQSSQDGYRLHLLSCTHEAGRQMVRFHILDAEGSAVRSFEEVHEAQLHFFAVRRDLAGFAHLHPRMDASGTWSVEVDLAPGAWRFLADFQPAAAGESLTLGADAFVPGPFRPAPLPVARTTATVDGYTVTLAGDLVPGEGRELTLSVAKDGEPVTDLDPYLGAYGHLVALRDGDLAYVHVHPEGKPGETDPGPDISFHTTAPSAGAYRLFLDFKHRGVVRTAAFTVDVGDTGADTGAVKDGSEEDQGHDQQPKQQSGQQSDEEHSHD